MATYPGYPNDQGNTASAIPVYLADGGGSNVTAYIEGITTAGSGTTPSNLKFVSFTLVSGTATVGGVSMAENSVMNFPIVSGATYDSISYTVGSASNLVIVGGY